ncbi:GNAT family N-acetyltransferase [Bradyrhizobium sp. LHD-71]|uniref:GNAT family N-acetyltransferase n=1 Tax=Bradyrhizobium sp. LHD-71 TaxID=3072141 RepID=UPI002810081B|nr:GNAT family N-acetyltransferase [Bradyrhizobium sp. LHD-71]MDQ8728648.1 GNAT family N-acetyltransferase [Bradyrhizobium sp. LHD-71]
MGQSMPKPGLRPYLPADAAVCAAIAEASITELTGDDYTEAQQEAWVAALGDDDLGRRLGGQLTLIATLREAPVGFASLKDGNHIDLLFVHPAAVGQGVATALLDALEKLAGARGATQLTADVSDTALRFFTRRGYAAQRRNTVPLGDEWLGNTTMQKTFNETSKGATQ